MAGRSAPTRPAAGDSFTASSILPGGSPGSGFGAYGGVPNIPNPIYSQGQALQGDIGQFPAFSNLAQMYNLANYGTQAQEVAGTPGFASVLSNLQGQIPKDVRNQLIQGAAERGVATGDIGSPNANAALLASLGLTSLDLQNMGQQQYGALLGHFPMAAPFDMQAFMTSPEQYQAAQTAANVNAAAPNPQEAAQAELDALKQAIAAGQGSIPGVRGLAPTLAGAPATGPGATTTPPPAVAYGGGVPPDTGPRPYQWPNQVPDQTGTVPGFGTGPTGSGPSAQDWQSFLDALNPNATAANTAFGLTPEDLAFLNSFQSPGFGDASSGAPTPTPGDWESFLAGLNPQQNLATSMGLTPDELALMQGGIGPQEANTWFGMTPDELQLALGGDQSVMPTPADFGLSGNYGGTSYADLGGP